MAFDPQTILETELVKLLPLRADDFEKLYEVAADPLMWLQHPNKNRYKKAEFTNFFEGAIASGGAYKITDKKTGDIIGSTRFYDYHEKEKSVAIGYTFLAVTCWGKGYNPSVKQVMMEHAFRSVDKIHFHIGAKNKRSLIAIERIGAIKIEEREIAYHGEESTLNFVFQITPAIWKAHLERVAEEQEKER